MRSVAALLVCVIAPSLTGQKTPPSGFMENKHVSVRASVFTDKDEIKSMLGSDLGGHYVVVRVELTPKIALKVFRDDFMLRSDRDGEKTKPYSASEIAGSSVLVVSQTYSGGGVMNNPRPAGGVWGPPIFLPADGQGIGNSSSEVSNQTTVDSGAARKRDPMMDILEEKILPEKETETDQPLHGLLFFPMNPKQKPKQLEFYFSTPSGRISMRFK